jgi:hypothetical protein
VGNFDQEGKINFCNGRVFPFWVKKNWWMDIFFLQEWATCHENVLKILSGKLLSKFGNILL